VHSITRLKIGTAEKLTDTAGLLARAETICRRILAKEYHGLLGLPMPQIRSMDADEADYDTGSYYIQIGSGWQIHLNMGRLPDDAAAFDCEVRALFRHEIEHYRTCPFDLLTHLRMSRAAHAVVGHAKLAAAISNQVADIIIDTHNYERFPQDTVAAERLWVQRGLGDLSRPERDSEKLMMQVKQALWQTPLGIDRPIDAPNPVAQALAETFQQGGIAGRRYLLDKVTAYAEKLKVMLIEEGQGDGEMQIPNGDGDQPLTPETVAEGDDVIQAALEAFAREVGLGDYLDILAAAGHLPDPEAAIKRYYRVNSPEAIELPYRVKAKSESIPIYPKPWRVADAPHQLDMVASLQVSPVLIPGLTTRQWEQLPSDAGRVQTDVPDLLLLLDSSGSMSWDYNDPSSPYHIALSAAFGLLKYYEDMQSQVAAINFSNQAHVIPWTQDYERVADLCLHHLGGGTVMPLDMIAQLMQANARPQVVACMTDSEISNWQACRAFFIEQLDRGQRVLIFIIGKTGIAPRKYDDFFAAGGHVVAANRAEDVFDLVVET